MQVTCGQVKTFLHFMSPFYGKKKSIGRPGSLFLSCYIEYYEKITKNDQQSFFVVILK